MNEEEERIIISRRTRSAMTYRVYEDREGKLHMTIYITKILLVLASSQYAMTLSLKNLGNTLTSWKSTESGMKSILGTNL